MNRTDKISSGIQGLDQIMNGGLIANRAYLLQGGPGTGKTSIGYSFVSQAVENGEEALYITMGESVERIRQDARKIGSDLAEVNFLDLTPGGELASGSDRGAYSVFPASEVEQKPIIDSIVEAVEAHKPTRVFLDSITMMQFLNQAPYQKRKLALSFIQYVCRQGATLLMTSEVMASTREDEARYWVDGIIELEYTPEWRKLSVSKYRGSDYMPDTHAFTISNEGVRVYPRLKPGGYQRRFTNEQLSSGIDELDNLLKGGIEQGTISLVTGPSGAGKTNLGIQFIKEAAGRGERSVIYSFEESSEIIIRRSESINVPIRDMIDAGNLSIVPVEPFSYSPDEFTAMVRRDVEENGTRFVMIDSVGGYSLAIHEEGALERLHALTVYLQNMGVTAFLINETQSITGTLETTNMHASYLADNIIFLRYLEMAGELQKVIGVLKKRLSDFERSIRRLYITGDGLKVGNKLDHMHGILNGMPSPVPQSNQT